MSWLNKKIDKSLNRYVPTGYATFDIMMGENVRKTDGTLISKNRGFAIGTHNCIASRPGAGKSTFTMDALSFGLHLGYPLHRLVVIDADNAVYTDQRLKKLTKLDQEVISDKFTVISTTSPDDLASIMKEVDAEYKEMKYKPVTFPDPQNPGKMLKMMPFVTLIVDTVTSIKSANNDIETGGDVINNTVGLTTNRELTEFTKSATNYCDGNIIIIWVAHLGDNAPKIGQYVAERDFKSAPIDKKIKVPNAVKAKLSSAFVLEKVVDSVDRGSASKGHVISRLNLDPSTNAFSTQGRMWKSRTGTEGSTITELVNINAEFDRFATLVIDCENIGVFKKGNGMYPSAEYPHIFKDSTDAEKEIKYMSTYKKQALNMDGWDRPFNLMEAFALTHYAGNDAKLCDLRDRFTTLCLENLEKKTRYELEVNNINSDDLTKHKTSIGLFMRINEMNKASNMFNPITDKDDSKAMIADGMDTKLGENNED